jgi:hypothetical protein
MSKETLKQRAKRKKQCIDQAIHYSGKVRSIYSKEKIIKEAEEKFEKENIIK